MTPCLRGPECAGCEGARLCAGPCARVICPAALDRRGKCPRCARQVRVNVVAEHAPRRPAVVTDRMVISSWLSLEVY